MHTWGARQIPSNRHTAHFGRPWLGGADPVGCVLCLEAVNRLRLLDMGARAASHSRYAADPDSSLVRPSSQALTLLGRVRFIAWDRRGSFLGKCRRGRRHFWNRQALCHTRAYLGRTIDTVDQTHLRIDKCCTTTRQLHRFIFLKF